MSERETAAVAVSEAQDGRAARRYALIFRTHFWDDFANRQLRRAAAAAPGADLWVLVDETRGRVEGISTPNVLSPRARAASSGSAATCRSTCSVPPSPATMSTRKWNMT